MSEYDQLAITYGKYKDYPAPLLYKSYREFPDDKIPDGFFYIDHDQDTVTIYGMVRIDEYATFESIAHFLRCLLSHDTSFWTKAQKIIPEEWPHGIIAHFRHQRQDRLWVWVRVIK